MWFIGFKEKHSWTREVKSIVKAQHDNRQQKQLGWFRVNYTPLSVFSVFFLCAAYYKFCLRSNDDTFIATLFEAAKVTALLKILIPTFLSKINMDQIRGSERSKVQKL